jgi:hypothetical protein
MYCQKEWSIFHIVEVQAVEPASKIEGANERTLIREEGTLNKVDCLRIFCSDVSATDITI